MREMTEDEALTSFDALLDAIEGGEQVTITRGGKAVALMEAPSSAVKEALGKKAYRKGSGPAQP